MYSFFFLGISSYHVPRAFAKPSDNLLVLFEENGGNPEGIKIVTVARDVLCSYITQYHPPHVKSWKRENSVIHTVVDDLKPKAHLTCPNHKVIVRVDFASFGNPFGACGSYTLGSCTSPNSKKIVEQVLSLSPPLLLMWSLAKVLLLLSGQKLALGLGY